MKNFNEGVRGYLFQGRFGSCVLDERHLLAAVRYVERNPVSAGIVNNAWEYPWSSAAYHVGDIGEFRGHNTYFSWGISGTQHLFLLKNAA